MKVVVYWGDVLYDTVVCNPNECLTVGNAQENSIVIPADPSFSCDSLKLVHVLSCESALLNFDNSVEGHVYLGKQFLKLNTAVEAGKTRRSSDGIHVLPITKRDRAELVIGHLSFYLEWVTTKSVLPKSTFKDKLLALFWTSLMTSSLFLSVFIIGQWEAPHEPEMKPERLVKVELSKPLPPKPPEIPKKPVEEKKPPVIKTPKLAQKPPKLPKDKPAPVAKPIGVQKPTGPSPEQMAAAAIQRKKAELSKSLGFITAAPSSAFQVNPNTYGASTEKYSKTNANADKLKSGNALMQYVPNTTDPNGPIQTKGLRSIERGLVYSENGVVGGTGVHPGNVRGKVAVSDLYGSGGGEIGQALDTHSGLALSGEGSLSEALIEKALAKHLHKLQYCYEKALLTDATLAGTLKMQWTISPGGKASQAKAIRSQMNNKDLHNCIAREIEDIQFPSPTGGSVIVIKPFSFSSSTL